MRRLDLTGERFGFWTALRLSAEKGNRGQVKWDCVCDCGNTKSITTSSLRRGSSKSCGCWFKKAEAHKTHGLSSSRLYRIYRHMLNRCYNQNVDSYGIYGGRGIKVCEEWHSFEPFCKWAVENGYEERLTLDRKDNDKGYFPANCQWSTQTEQQRNKRSNVLTMAKAREIRRMRNQGIKNIEVANFFGISTSLACDVYKNKVWKEGNK